MGIQEAKRLIQKYNTGLCDEAEKTLVENTLLEFREDGVDLAQERIDRFREEIYNNLPVHGHRRRKRYLWTGAAAAVTIAVLAIAHWRLEENLQRLDQVRVIEDVAPIGDRANLTLADGRIIALNGAKEGLRLDGGKLNYLDGTRINNGITPQMSQTLSTPKGGQYRVVLQDGTKVWLNAASSITYPSSFDGAKERRVAITGEVYFEVAKDRKRPFLVASNQQSIRVLGTHFNVNAYGDNGTTITTLLEGSVSVASFGIDGEKVLKPLEQLVADRGGSYVKPADKDLTMAWKNGMLEFRDASLSDILSEVARWYDLQVEYKGEISNRIFTGSVSRHSNLSVLLKILSYSDIRFRIETNGSPTKKLIVEP